MRKAILAAWIGMAMLPATAARADGPKPYTVSETFAEVSNRKQLDASPEQRALLAKNLFVAMPTDLEQLFFVYEENEYGNLPSFVTTDLVLQLYHVFYDAVLRKVEAERLLPLARELAKGMLKQAVATWTATPEPEVKAAALKLVAWFGVADRLLGLADPIPPEAVAWVDADVARVTAHAGLALGDILPYKLDWSQFQVRGHYTRSKALKQYFLGMAWFGMAPFAFKRQVEKQGSVVCHACVRMALLLARDLYAARLDGKWESLYEPTAFFVGASDDVTPAQLRGLVEDVYGKDPAPAAFADPGRLEQLVGQATTRFQARIRARVRHTLGTLLPFPDPEAPQLRFMGQRYIPDSEAMQRLTFPGADGVAPRFFPAGMDVMAVLGSARARTHLDGAWAAHFDTKAWPGYGPARAALEAEFARLGEADWSRNLYVGWLWTLQALLDPPTPAHPSFMQSPAWLDKSLLTALASWTELRHDTLLYGKQSMTAAECGGDEPPPPPKGYVEPNLEFYRRLERLARTGREGLSKRGLLPKATKEKYERFEGMLRFLASVAEKELAGREPTREEYERIRGLGSEVEWLTLGLQSDDTLSRWYEVKGPDKDLALVADVHTGSTPEGRLMALEEAVGHVAELLVIVPAGGKLVLARGAMFTYHEFRQPIEDRLTDEAWQKRLKASDPDLPPWTKTFVAPRKKGKKGSIKVETYSSGC